jgi:quercetin dioxygenase-like cupin family protein
MKAAVRFPSLVRAAIFIAGAGFTLSTFAVHTGAEQPPVTIPGDAVNWGAAPPTLPSGAQASVLHGNPGKPGPFVLRLRFPAGYVVPPHRHSKDELVTVISGKFGVVGGETVDRKALKPVVPGSFINIPAGTSHYAIAESESIVQINGDGPFDITYLNPNDDPRAQ